MQIKSASAGKLWEAIITAISAAEGLEHRKKCQRFSMVKERLDGNRTTKVTNTGMTCPEKDKI